jgi:hypothetical protein
VTWKPTWTGLALSQSGAVLYVTDGDNAKLRTVSATASEGGAAFCFALCLV